MGQNITVSKNNINVVIHTEEVNDDYKNKIFLITPPQTKANQEDGPKPVRVVDLLRLTHTVDIRGRITGDTTSTVLEVKNNLISIMKGAQTNGGTVHLSYEGYDDGLDGYIEGLTFTEVSSDEPDTLPSDYPKYTVKLVFIEGTTI